MPTCDASPPGRRVRGLRFRTLRLMPIAAAAGLLLTSAATARSQVNLPIGGERPSFQLEIEKPTVDSYGVFAGARFFSTVWDASVALPLSAGPTLFARIGLAYCRIDGIGGSATSSSPRLGALFGRVHGVSAEVHVDLPLAREMGQGEPYSTGLAQFTDFEGLERYQLDTWAVGGALKLERELDPGMFVGARAGGALTMPTEDSADRELFVTYALLAHAPMGANTRLGIEFSGVTRVTQRPPDLNDLHAFFATVSIGRPRTSLAPRLFVRVPLDDALHSAVGAVVGLSLTLGSADQPPNPLHQPEPVEPS